MRISIINRDVADRFLTLMSRTYRVFIIGRNLNTDLYTDAVRSNAFFGVPLDKPPRTGEVIIDNVTSTSVSLHWTPPAGDVTMYRIEVSDDTAFVDGRRVRLSEFGLAPGEIWPPVNFRC